MTLGIIKYIDQALPGGGPGTNRAVLNAARDQLLKSVVAARANQDASDPGANAARLTTAATLTSATYDAATDTFTIASGGSVRIDLPQTDTWLPAGDPLTRYFAVATVGDDASALTCKFRRGNAVVADIVVLADFAPGVKFGTATTIPSGTTTSQLLVTNTGPASVQIFYPYAGTSYPIIDQLARKFRNGGKPVERRDYSFKSVASRAVMAAAEAACTVFIDSVDGSDSNNGTSITTPKKTLAGAQSIAGVAGARIGLLEGSRFNDYLTLAGSNPGQGLDRVSITRVSKGGRSGLPLFDQTFEPDPSAWISNGDGSWKTTVTAKLGNNAYHSVGVIIGVTALVPTKPMTAWRRMMEGSAVAAYPGLYSTTPFGGSGNQDTSPVTYTVTVWPPDGAAPGTGLYRYRVINNFAGLLWNNAVDFHTGYLSGADFFGACSGYGSLNGPGQLLAKNIVLRHGSTHHAVVSSGHVQNVLMWDHGDGDSIGWTFYKPDGTGNTWSITDAIAYGFSGYTIFYAHTSGASHSRGDIKRFAAFDPVPVTTPLALAPTMTAQNTAAVRYEDCYVNAGNAFGISRAVNASTDTTVIERCVVIDAAFPFARDGSAIGTFTIQNNFVRTRSASHPTDVNTRGSSFVLNAATGGAGERMDVLNNTAHIRATAATLVNDASVSVYPNSRPKTNKFNLFVLEVPFDTVDHSIKLWTVDESNPNDWQSDYNFIVIVGKRSPNGAGVAIGKNVAPSWDWDTYRSATGLDAHSMLIDLRGNPLGAALIWNDPDNFDYRLADTPYTALLDRWMRTYGVGCDFTLHGLPRVPDPDQQYLRMREL